MSELLFNLSNPTIRGNISPSNFFCARDSTSQYLSMFELMCIADPWWRLPKCNVLCFKYHRTQDKKTCSNGVKDMKCFATTHLKFDCRTKGYKLFICFFYQRILFIFHFPQPLGIFLTQKQHTWENKSSRQQWPTPNFECLAANKSCLHPVRTCFFLTCTHLDATDGIMVVNKFNSRLAKTKVT